MDDKKQARLRRAKQTRLRIQKLKVVRLSVHRSNSHIYAQLFDDLKGKVLASASTLDPSIRKEVDNGSNVKAAALVGGLIGSRAISAGIKSVAFDRSGFKYHGRIKALADAAREAGLEF